MKELAAKAFHRRPSQNIWILFLAGPVIWYGHFWLVYLLVEAVCDAGGSDARWLGLRPLSFLTVATTALAAGLALLFTAWAWRRYRQDGRAPDAAVAESEHALAFTGALLGLVFFVSILFVGLPALFLRPC